ncbi:hypothetical protein KSC_025210 [Ktedonobacter sp. SOSP1-52]|uniref:arsenite efflux transporter metallochaperone ArsD n=1 Tax=Ktedonobacter sp. SOSP1-52 TaxID=2778366 RepID=UPI00191542F5|nr:arsenite efflux transporter metallochaperone ArsD [Ktedonobacter sp. SOSP1-52]GHO63629.1 hypothetical protein KSC_025210 [Ktedonobacter sp. SOSP1-52]
MLSVVSVKKATLSVYDPAMCCATGVCGPAIDPKLIEVANDLRWLAEQGVAVERYNLAQQPEAFVNHPRVNGLLQAFGENALPAILINDNIVFHGHYPLRDELVNAIKQAATSEAPASKPTPPTSGNCCDPESGCC